MTLSLTDVVDLDGDVDVDPIVELDVDQRPSPRAKDRSSRCNVDGGVDVYVAVDVKVGVDVNVEVNANVDEEL